MYERCGLVSIIKKRNWQECGFVPVPLKSIQIVGRLVNAVAEVTVTQAYQNVEENPIECEYMFPVEEEAAVVSFKAELDGRTLISKVKANQEAEKDYKDAVAKGKTGFLVQSIRPDILHMKIGHLAPGAKCTVSITYITETPLDGTADTIRLTIPTTISPKYIPYHDSSVEAKKIKSIKYDFSSPAPMKFTIDALMSSPIDAITSPSHDIKTTGLCGAAAESGFYKAQVELAGKTTADLDRDILLLVKCEAGRASVVLHEKYTTTTNSEDGSAPSLFGCLAVWLSAVGSGDGGESMEVESGVTSSSSTVLMLSLVPRLQLRHQPSLDIVFLIDCSGSMMGSSIKLARDAINILLHSLPATAYFNIVRFGSTHVKLFPEGSVPYSDETLGVAKKAMQGLEADLGGTEILTPLKGLLKEKSKWPRRVFVLTDGSVSNSMECLRVTRKYNKDCKVFALGIGAAADRHLVKGLARAGLGTSEFTVEGEMIAPKVIKQLKHCLQPSITNVQLQWGNDANAAAANQTPSVIPSLYNDSRIQVFHMLEHTSKSPDDLPTAVTITADIPSAEEKYSETVPVSAGQNCLEGGLLHKMFARKMIQELEENLDDNNDDTTTVGKASKEMITKLALKYQLVSKYTSIVAVDSKDNKSELPMQSRSIPHQVPTGFHGGAMRKMRGKCMPFASFGAAPAMKIYNFAPTRNYLKAAPAMSFDAAAPLKMRCSGFPVDYLVSDASLDVCTDEANSDSVSDADPVDQVIRLISKQMVAGCFDADPQILQILNLTAADVDGLADSSGGSGERLELRIVYTLLVLVALELRYASLKSSWELVADKAEGYLASAGHQLPEGLRETVVQLLSHQDKM